MHIHHWYRRTILGTAAVLVGSAIHAAQPQPSVAYPEGFRTWQHVKTTAVGAAHASFPNRGGFHHFYANALALEGYRTGTFPNGSVIVDENVLARDGEGRQQGILLEGDRRGIDVMVKDDRVFKDTGGWGFEQFKGTGTAGTLSSAGRTKCFECHGKMTGRDSVFSTLRQ